MAKYSKDAIAMIAENIDEENSSHTEEGEELKVDKKKVKKIAGKASVTMRKAKMKINSAYGKVVNEDDVDEDVDEDSADEDAGEDEEEE